MNVNEITMSGNIVYDPKFSGGNQKVSRCYFRIANTHRWYSESQGGWVDGDTTFIDVVCWRSMAENSVQSLDKGMPVIVTGRLTSTTVEAAAHAGESGAGSTDQPRKITKYHIDATAVGINLARVATQIRSSSDTKSTAVQRQEAHALRDAADHPAPPF